MATALAMTARALARGGFGGCRGAAGVAAVFTGHVVAADVFMRMGEEPDQRLRRVGDDPHKVV
jgi:hypothetical protein